MRTARLLPVSPSLHCSGGHLAGEGVPARGGSCEQNSWHTLRKILPWPKNSFAGGNKLS